jgi:hypothetical protein
VSCNVREICLLLSAVKVKDFYLHGLNILITWVTSGYRHVVDEVFALLGCYTAYVYSCLSTFRGSLSVQS